MLDPAIAEHKGRVFKATGDGVLVEFPSVVNAVSCATQIQLAMQRDPVDVPSAGSIKLRIGVNVGDVIVDDDDIFGDGVNLAARLEGVAPAGGVAISGMVREQVGTRLDVRFEDMGERELKNIARPVRVFSVSAGQNRSSSEALRFPASPQ